MKTQLNKQQLTFIIILAVALGIRSLGMSIVAPFISNFTLSLKFGTIALSGIALGGFSFTQAFFQIPFGNWCDKFGNKKMILIGLLLLILGLALSTVSTNAYIFIISRFLQGTGAITSGVFSWISSEVGEEKRADAIGLTSIIVSAFSAIALAGGPLLILIWNVQELYGIATFLVICVFLIILFALKDNSSHSMKEISKEVREKKSKETSKYIWSFLKDIKFLGFCFVGFFSIFMFMADFVLVPEYADKLVGEVNLWMIFTPSMLIGLIAMKISVIFIKKSYTKELAVFSGILFVVGNAMLIYSKNSLVLLIVSSVFTFTGYFILVNLVPTITNQIAKPEFRGSLNGVVNAFMYIGGFVGSALIGLLWGINENFAIYTVIFLSIVVTIIGFLSVPKIGFHEEEVTSFNVKRNTRIISEQ